MELQFDRHFLEHTEAILGPSRFPRFMAALSEDPPVSIRLNRAKADRHEDSKWESVPWCSDGFYLDRRPNFTFDPLLHAGCYYVQEASSMFITHAVTSTCLPLLSLASPSPVPDLIPGKGSSAASASPTGRLAVLDLCAAPGGKSTALCSVLPLDSVLISNEPVRLRAQILSENIQKWGCPNCIVTNNLPADFARLTGKSAVPAPPYDLILCDVPCSGEGMFRKDPATIAHWSDKGVERCQQLQQEIVRDIWPCLRPGGILIYSTCTYNTLENEENVKWIMEHLGADCIKVPTVEEWGITGSLLHGFEAPVCRFIPGLTRGEGLFMAVLRKTATDRHGTPEKHFSPDASPANSHKDDKGKRGRRHENNSSLNVLFSSISPASCTPSEALSTSLDATRYPIVELPYATAIEYLRRQSIVLPEATPKGHVIVAFKGHPLGFVKNIGTRANNLYPREWAIKSTYVPNCDDNCYFTNFLPSQM